MQQDLFSQWEQHALLSRDETAYDTVRFFRNAKVIFDLFDEWKNKDRFYFIPLKLGLTYCMGGHTFRMSEDEIHLGTFIRTIQERDDLFTGTCPECGRKLYPYGVLGPTLIFRVRLEACCDCGWRGKVFSGDWAVWNVALRRALKKDRRRLITARMFNPFFKVTTIESLMEYLWQ